MIGTYTDEQMKEIIKNAKGERQPSAKAYLNGYVIIESGRFSENHFTQNSDTSWTLSDTKTKKIR